MTDAAPIVLRKKKIDITQVTSKFKDILPMYEPIQLNQQQEDILVAKLTSDMQQDQSPRE